MLDKNEKGLVSFLLKNQGFLAFFEIFQDQISEEHY